MSGLSVCDRFRQIAGIWTVRPSSELSLRVGRPLETLAGFHLCLHDTGSQHSEGLSFAFAGWAWQSTAIELERARRAHFVSNFMAVKANGWLSFVRLFCLRPFEAPRFPLPGRRSAAGSAQAAPDDAVEAPGRGRAS